MKTIPQPEQKLNIAPTVTSLFVLHHIETRLLYTVPGGKAGDAVLAFTCFFRAENIRHELKLTDWYQMLLVERADLETACERSEMILLVDEARGEIPSYFGGAK